MGGRDAASLPSVSVCFPCFNEEATIADVLLEAHELLAASDLDYEILVCDDCSTDRTGTIIAQVRKRIPELRVLTHPVNQGIFRTFEDLYAAAAKDYVFLNSTDRQWDTRLVFEMLPLTKDHDVIITSRTNKPYGPLRAVVSWGFNVLPRVLFGTATYDAGSVKLTKREIIERFPARVEHALLRGGAPDPRRPRRLPHHELPGRGGGAQARSHARREPARDGALPGRRGPRLARAPPQ